MMFSPVLVVFLTMLYSPTVTTKSTKAPTLGSLFTTCDDVMELFLDGVKYTDAAMKDVRQTSEVSFPLDTGVIAISCKDTGGWEGILASTTTGIVTDGSWKCSSVKEDYWEMSDFDDSAWNNADISRGTNEASSWGLRANINNDAHWIWSEGTPTKTTQAYCRKSLVTDTCCDTVQLTSTDATFLASKYGGFVGNYSLHRSNPFANDRKIYNHDSSNYCLFWSRGAWRIDAHCTTTDSTGNAITFKTSDTYSQCPHGGDFVWQWSSTNNQDPTMKVSCTAAANVCIDTGCQKTGVGEDVDAECVYLKNANWTSISHIYNVSTPWKEGLCKGADFEEDCCKCLPRLPVGCVDVEDACKNAFGGLGVCKNFVKDDMSTIDFEQGSKKNLCNADKPDCCECFSLKKMKTTKP